MNNLLEKIKTRGKELKNRASEFNIKAIKLMKDNVLEILVILGIISISIGAFIYSKSLGFIVLGVLILILAGLIFWQRGGD